MDRPSHRLLSVSSLLAAAICAMVIAIPVVVGLREDPTNFTLEVTMVSARPAVVQTFFDDGAGYRERLSSRETINGNPSGRVVRMPIPAGAYRSFRFDPVDNDGEVRIASFRILDKEGTTIRDVLPNEFRPLNQIDSLVEIDGHLEVTMQSGSIDPQLLISFDPPLDLGGAWTVAAKAFLRSSAMVFFLFVGVLGLIDFTPQLRTRCMRMGLWLQNRPATAVILTAVLATVVANYPVIFLGRSYVSPNFSDGSVLLYEGFPTLPGYDDPSVEKAMGSDVGAMGWHHLPLSIVEHRALFRDGELPLFNRYNSGGVALLGQGQSMFGDPLHFLPIFANGAAWAWDTKYIVARWLFACGLGLIVLITTRHVPSALLTASTCVFIGFFIYRLNHPAQFSLCYSPWILYAWIRLQQAHGSRATVCSLLGLALANWMVMTSGTVKEAYVLLLGLNLTGVLIVLGSTETWSSKCRKFGSAIATGILFVCASAPIWLTFYQALKVSYTTYDQPTAYQIDPSLLLGLFDEIFYRVIQIGERIYNPSANFVVLFGVLYLIATFRRTAGDRMKLVLCVATLVPLAIAFGLVPPEWIVQVPFLRNVAHIDNSFSCVLIVHLIIVSGYGYRSAWDRLGTPEGRGDLCVVTILLGALIFPWVALVHTVTRVPFGPGTTYTFLDWGQHLPVSNFAWGSLILLPVAGLLGLLLLRRARLRGSWTASTAMFALLCLAVLVWRHGQHDRLGFSDYVYNPGVRVDLHAKSEAITFVQDDATNPYRVVGFDGNLIPGWSATYNLETVSGPDAVVNRDYRDVLNLLQIERLWDWRVMTRESTMAKVKRGYDFLNTRYFLKPPGDETELPGGLVRVKQADLDVFESNEAWPRAFFSDRISVYDDASELGRLIATGDGRPFAAVRSDTAGPVRTLPIDQENRTVVHAQDYRLTVNTTTFAVTASGPGVVALHESWYTDSFHATVNGQPVDCFRVNHGFKGVYVDSAGTYRISFSYWPPYLTFSLVLAAVGFVGFCGMGWLGWRQSTAFGLLAKPAILASAPPPQSASPTESVSN